MQTKYTGTAVNINASPMTFLKKKINKTYDVIHIPKIALTSFGRFANQWHENQRHATNQKRDREEQVHLHNTK